MRLTERTFFFLAFALAGISSAARAELALPRESPPARLSQRVGLTDITIEYVSPAVKGRKVWGALVPYGQPWGFGGSQAPKIHFGTDVTVGDKLVPAGTYALFAIPEKGEWTLSLNKNSEQPGSGRDYRAELDVARVRVRPKTVASRERLTFQFASFTDDQASLQGEWDKLAVVLPIGVNTTRKVTADLAGLDSTWRSYANAARYMLETKKDYPAALKYIDQSLALKEDWYNAWIKALILAGQDDYKAAERQAQLAYDLGVKSGDASFPEAELKRALGEWSQKGMAARW